MRGQSRKASWSQRPPSPGLGTAPIGRGRSWQRPRSEARPVCSAVVEPGRDPGCNARSFLPLPPPQMLEQSLREEELRAQHQAALLRLRQKALEEKMRAERAWLNWLKLQRR